MSDSQIQTLDLLSDLENIVKWPAGQALENCSLLSDMNIGPYTQLPSNPTQNPATDCDIKELFSASYIQTQI